MKKITLIVSAFAAISAVATVVSPAYATAMGEMQAPAHADTEPLAQAGGPGPGRGAMPLHKRNYYGKQQKPNARITPKVCYERKRVGPQNYVIVRRAC